MENKIYTRQDWQNDRTFKAAIGQQVAEDVYQSFLNDMPPHYRKNGIMQGGEPYGHTIIEGHIFLTYITFTGCEGHRTCQGHMPSLHEMNTITALKNRIQF